MSDDPWRQELDEHLGALRDAVTNVCEAWMETPADQPAALLEAARGISSSAVTSACQANVSAIESWLCEQHNQAVETFADEAGVPIRSSWRMLPDGWLYRQVQPDVRILAHDFGRAREACVAIAEFYESNSGVMGLAKNALIGAINPLEGIAAIFGESSMHEEARRLNSAAEATFGDADNHLTALSHAVDTAVVSTWNSTTVGVLTAIEEEAQSRALTGKTHSHGSAPLDYSNSSSTGGWGPIIGLLAVVGLGAWGAYSFFGPPDEQLPPQHTEPVPTESSRLGVLKPGALRAGPGDSFETVMTIEKATASHLLDDSVPGWIKVRLADGQEGWTDAQRFSE